MKTFLFRSTFAHGLALVLFFGTTMGLRAAEKMPKMPVGAVDRGPLVAATPVQATVYLAPEAARTAALLHFLTDVATPASKSYKKWVTASEFAAQFGATEAQTERVTTFAESVGLKVVSVSGLRVVVQGTAGAVEQAFAPGLHRVAVVEATGVAKEYVVSTAAVALPAALAKDIAHVGGMNTLPDTSELALAADGAAVKAGKHGSLEDLADTVEANTARVLTLSGTACEADFSSNERAAMQNVLREAAAQGQSVLALSGCVTTGAVSFPAVLPEVTAVTLQPVTESGVAELARPWWQTAPGLPSDTLRHEPDVMVGDLSALAATFAQILAKMPASSDGTPARLGNVTAELYQLAPTKGLYTQPDAATTGLVGNWEAATGLGVVDLQKLLHSYATGTASTYITVTTQPGFATHGTTITFSAEVKDISGTGTAPPTGTISFSTDSGVFLGSNTLTPDGAVSAATSVMYNKLAANGYNVIATYSGDGFYASGQNQTNFTVGAEEGTLAATVASAVPLGGMIQVTITDQSREGVGTPNVTGYVIPQGIPNPATYTVPLTGAGTVASGNVSIPATIAGALTLFVGCTSKDPNFTCYNSINVTATVNKATPTMTLSVTPPTPTANVNPVFTAQVTGVAGQVVPTGVVIFFDNGVNIGQNGLDGTGKCVFTGQPLDATKTHSLTATYFGDNNYVGASASPMASGAVATTAAVTVSPNPPVNGSTTTVTATISDPGYTGLATVGGSATFVVDGTSVGTSPVVGGVGTYTTTSLGGNTEHTFQVLYLGDATFASSTSPVLTTSSSTGVATTTALAVTPNPPILGSTTTLTATVSQGTNDGTALPGGTMTFFMDGTALTTTATVVSGVASYSSTAIGESTAHRFSAVYSGDTVFAASASQTVTTMGPAVASKTALMVSPNPPVNGNTTTLTAAVSSDATSSTAVPTGTVTFLMDGTALTTTATVNAGGVATFTSTAIRGTTSHAFSAVYSGDTLYAGSTSPTVNSVAAGTTPTTFTLAVNPLPPVAGQTTTLTAKLTASAAGVANSPMGTVTFLQDGVALSPASPLVATSAGTATATYQSTALSGAAAHSYTASYNGDTVFAANTSQVVTSPAASTGSVASVTTLTGSAPTAVVNGTVTYTVTVASGSTSSMVVPTGTVTLTNASGTVLGSALLNALGVAMIPYSPAAAGTLAITATYSGDTVYAASTSTSVSLVVGSTTLPAGVLTLQLVPTSIPFGGSLTANAAVTGTTSDGVGPTGSVTFVVTNTVGGAAVGSFADALTPTSTTTSTASQQITGGTPGSYTVTAACATTNITCSATAALGFLVTKGQDTVTLTASPNPPVTGQSEVLTATIAPTFGGTGTFTGFITFYVNNFAIGSSPVNGNTATFTTTLPSTSNNILYAVYSGDANWLSATSSTLTLSVPPTPTSSVLTTSATNALQGSNVLLTMVVTALPASQFVTQSNPSGSVVFYDTFNGVQTKIGTVSLTPSGQFTSIAQLGSTSLLAGTHTILAVYMGSTAFSSSSAATVQVDVTDYTVAFSPSSATVQAGGSLTALVTVAAVNGFNGEVVLGCVPPAGTATTCSFSPAVITGSGISTLTITTTKTTGALRFSGAVGEVTFAVLLTALLLPGVRRKKPVLMAVFVSGILLGAVGCTTVQSGQGITNGGDGSGSGGSGGSTGGTPSGTQMFAITASGTDGRTTNRHTYQFELKVQ